jgi:hypothetical protein
MLLTIITVIHVLLAAALIGLVLFQRGKGAEAGAAFGAGASGTDSPRSPGWVFRPRWTSISVSSIRSKADFIINRISPLRSSAVLAWEAISLANSSALDRNDASMCQSPVQKRVA